MRTTKEWVGKTDDARPPPRVLLRILERDKRRCYLSGEEIRAGDAWDAEHVVALADGGENRELNMRPALRKHHKGKTAKEAKARAKVRKTAKAHYGIKNAPARPLRGHPFPKTEQAAKRQAKGAQRLPMPPRRLLPGFVPATDKRR